MCMVPGARSWGRWSRAAAAAGPTAKLMQNYVDTGFMKQRGKCTRDSVPAEWVSARLGRHRNEQS